MERIDEIKIIKAKNMIENAPKLNNAELVDIGHDIKDVQEARKQIEEARKKIKGGEKNVNEEEETPWVKYQCVKCGEEFVDFPNVKVLHWHETDAKKPKKYAIQCDAIGVVESAVPKKLMEIVSSPDYGERLIAETDKRIIGEQDVKKVMIPTQLGGRLVENAKPTSYNVMFSAGSGEGKDYVATNILSLLPISYFDHKTRLSEKALSYYHPSAEEPYYSWKGKILYCEDANNSFLNSDTVKVMMTGGSDIAIVDKGRLKLLKINGSPVFLVTSATAEPNKELTRRISSLGMDSSEGQTEEILRFQSETAINGLVEYDKDLINSTYLLTILTIEIEYAKKLLEGFPKDIQARTNFDRLLDLIKANAALHQHSREWKDNTTIKANGEDLKKGLEMFKILYPQRAVSLTHLQKKLVDYLSQINIPRSAPEIFRESGHFYYSQLGKLIEGLRSLANKGFVDISEGDRSFKTVDLYKYIPELDTDSLGSKYGK